MRYIIYFPSFWDEIDNGFWLRSWEKSEINLTYG